MPAGWHIATALPASGDAFTAPDYDHMVDSPVEIGAFQESDFDEGGGHYRVIVDADPSAYDMRKIVAMLRRLVSSATVWMDDRPFQTYLFFYHFRPGAPAMAWSTPTAPPSISARKRWQTIPRHSRA